MSGIARLWLVWGALMTLLALTLGAAFLPLGPVKPWMAYGIAAAKAALVLVFFMDLRRESGLARLATLAAFTWLAILFLLVTADVATRGWWIG